MNEFPMRRDERKKSGVKGGIDQVHVEGRPIPSLSFTLY